MRTRLKQLRALLNVTDPEFYQFLSKNYIGMQTYFVSGMTSIVSLTHTSTEDKESHNLYFCFRWLLVNFKREFSYEGIMTIWEVSV